MSLYLCRFSLTDDEYNHSCAGSESNDTDDYPDPSICAFGCGRNYLCLNREFGGCIAACRAYSESMLAFCKRREVACFQLNDDTAFALFIVLGSNGPAVYQHFDKVGERRV